MMMTRCTAERDWRGLYRADFDLVTPESMAHPAKMAWSLVFRILEHLKELGLLRDGDTVLDNMAGTGRTCIAACALGYRAISVELEEKFVAMQRENKAYAERKLGRELDWTILRGDSRQLSDLLTERGLVTVTSPPYQDVNQDNRKTRNDTCNRNNRLNSIGIKYSDNPANIGNLRDRVVGVTSPPYEGDESTHIRGRAKDIERMTAKGMRVNPESHSTTTMEFDYGVSPGQIGQERAESYLSAMRVCYAEVARVADVLVVVVKDPTRDHQIRRLGRDTMRLLRQTGWRLHCYHRAILFEEQETANLFGESKRKVKGRLSFFKRLSWQKGSPVANYEHVLVCTRDGARTGVRAVVSPPYQEAGDERRYGGLHDTKAVEGLHSTFSKFLGKTPGQIGNLR